MTTQNRRFSSETASTGVRTIGCMRSQVTTVALAIVLAMTAASSSAWAADSPLDFAYRVTGTMELRPLLVFNDGEDTYIQPQDPADMTVLVNGVQPVRQGPYFVVRGVGASIAVAQGNKASVQITYAKAPKRTAPATVEPREVDPASGRSVAKAAPTVAGAVAAPAGTTATAPKLAETAKPCSPRRVQRESAFVASFRSGTSQLSDLAKAEIKKFVGETSSISSVNVIGEGAGSASGQKRADAIKAALIGAGVDGVKVETSVRQQTGIGTEIHIQRSIEVPCGAGIVTIPSRKSHVTIVWDRDAKELAERIAKSLNVKFTVAGTARELPVRVAAVDTPFVEAMQRVGKALDGGADLVLRPNELILRFKEKQ